MKYGKDDSHDSIAHDLINVFTIQKKKYIIVYSNII